MKHNSPSSQTPDFHPFLFEDGNENHVDFLQREGQKKLAQGNSEGIQLFSLAANLDPNNSDLLFEQGVALFRYGHDRQCKKYLLLANKKFKSAIKLAPDRVQIWSAWSKSLFILGQSFGEFHFFLEAKEKYTSAIKHYSGNNEIAAAQIYWDFGQVLFAIAEKSGESSDLHEALEAHTKSASLGEDLPAKFWEDFGVVALKLGEQINDVRLYLKAINCHKSALAKSVSGYRSWYLLAHALGKLYHLTHDEDHFCQANECFTNAAKLQPQNGKTWFEWGELLLASGEQASDKKRLHSAIEKCRRAYTCGENNQHVMVSWAVGLAMLGALSGRLDLIFEGNNKVMEALNIFGNTPHTLYAAGRIQFAFGRYYSDLDHYYQAIEKFQEGLSVDRSQDLLWYYLGHTYAILAKEEQDPALFERAGKFFTKALLLSSSSLYYYEYACSLANLAEIHQDTSIAEKALFQFDRAFGLQRNAVYLHPQWLMKYAMALDLMGDLCDEDQYYLKAIEILKRVLMLEPDFPEIHYKIAYVYSHLGELVESTDVFERALSHYKLAYQANEENETLTLDWALTFINLAEITSDASQREQYFREAEYKLIQSAKLGNVEAYYHLACLYSLTGQFERAIIFLQKAESYHTLPAIDEMFSDDWLENLRSTDLFQSFIAHL